MCNCTNGLQRWRDRLQDYIDQPHTLFHPKYNQIKTKLSETQQKCNFDQISFKAYLARWFAA
jgi:mannan endo-1,6-alpha-mannosidase